MTETSTTTPRIYVASLSDYNAGVLHGRWIDADQDADDIAAEVRAMLAASPAFASFPEGGPAEEWAIHDYEGFEGWRLSEWESFETVATVGRALAEANDPEALGVWLEYSELDPAEAVESFEDCYRGTFDSLRAWAEEWFEETTSATEREAASEWPYYCIDWDHAAEALRLEMSANAGWMTVDKGYGALYVFDPEAAR